MKALILAGGSGTRLWPLSTSDKPKQFVKFNSEFSLLQQCIKRCLLYFDSADIFIISRDKYRNILQEQISPFNLGMNQCIFEPKALNTAPAIAYSISKLKLMNQLTDDESIFIFPSDHKIENHPDLWISSLELANRSAIKGDVVTFGITPSKPSTAYGYIEIESASMQDEILKVKRFVEKPDLKTAQEFIESKKFFWNAGMCVMNVKSFLYEASQYAPDLLKIVTAATTKSLENAFLNIKAISLDYAILERSKKTKVIPLKLEWCDMGSWDSIFEEGEKDAHNNVITKQTAFFDAKDSLCLPQNKRVVLVDVSELVVVETEDTILVTKLGASQESIRKAVYSLSKDEGLLKNVSQLS